MTQTVSIRINGRQLQREVPDQMLLVHFIRDVAGLTGTHVGCDTAQCGACTVHLDGRAVKSCNQLAAQADGCELTTIEGIAAPGKALHPVQEAFRKCHGLQCGYCTPGMVMSAIDLLKTCPRPTEAQIAEHLDGNLCRCTGYYNIVKSIGVAAQAMSARE
jgi:carbon-monoxide dehydrogenase small subunit